MKYYIVIFFFMLIAGGCRKYLEKRSDSTLATIESVEDLQALLDENNRISSRKTGVTLQCSDDFFLDESYLGSLDETAFNQYVWAAGNQFKPGNGNDWAYLYYAVFTANVVLEEAEKLSSGRNMSVQMKDVVGQGFFLRGYSTLIAATIWSLAYEPGRADSQLGVPLPTSSNINVPSFRTTLEQTYQQIVSDFKKSASLLPSYSIHPLRPSKAAAFGALARTFLYMADFDMAEKYADSALQIKSSLMDFNQSNYIHPNDEFRFERFNPEVVFDCTGFGSILMVGGFVDTTLYRSYSQNDLRKQLFFQIAAGVDSAWYRGMYSGGLAIFQGITVPELYLIRSESRIRNGRLLEGINDINHLLKHRITTGSYSDFTTPTTTEALAFVLQERRKETACTPLRWMDIKRLNQLGGNIHLRRIVQGVEFDLPPRDLRSALSIPEDIIVISGMQQNPR